MRTPAIGQRPIANSDAATWECSPTFFQPKPTTFATTGPGKSNAGKIPRDGNPFRKKRLPAGAIGVHDQNVFVQRMIRAMRKGELHKFLVNARQLQDYDAHNRPDMNAPYESSHRRAGLWLAGTGEALTLLQYAKQANPEYREQMIDALAHLGAYEWL
jgi:hypothetical protein